LTMWK